MLLYGTGRLESLTFIDNDYFWPHNIARHILASNDIGYTKVKSLENLSRLIQSDSDLIAIAADVFSENPSVHTTFSQADVILDASASIAVERYLALDIQSNAQRISCFLNPQGTATVMLLESTDRTVRLDLLEMQYYRELLTNEKYSDHMSLPESIELSTSLLDEMQNNRKKLCPTKLVVSLLERMI